MYIQKQKNKIFQFSDNKEHAKKQNYFRRKSSIFLKIDKNIRQQQQKLQQQSFSKTLQNYQKIIANKLLRIYKSIIYQIIINTVYFWLLVGFYLKMIIQNQSYTLFYEIFLYFSLVILLLEMTIIMFLQHNYLFSVFFFLDLFQIGIIYFDSDNYDSIVYRYSCNSHGMHIFLDILQLLRTLRIARITKIFSNISLRKHILKDPRIEFLWDVENITFVQKLKQNNIIRLSLSISLISLLYPLFSYDFWIVSYVFDLKQQLIILTKSILQFPNLQNLYIEQNNKIYEQFYRQIAYLKIENIYEYGVQNLDKISNIGYDYCQQIIEFNGIKYNTILILDKVLFQRYQFMLKLINVFVLSLILFFSIWYIQKNFIKDIISPMESFIFKIRNFTLDPYLEQKSKFLESQQKDKNIFFNKIIKQISDLLVEGTGKNSLYIFNTIWNNPKYEFYQYFPREKTYCIFVYFNIKRIANINEQEIEQFIEGIQQLVYEIVEFNQGEIFGNLSFSYLLVWECKEIVSNVDQNLNHKEKQIIKDKLEIQLQIALLTCIRLAIEIKNYSENQKKQIEPYFGIDCGRAQKIPLGSGIKLNLSYFSKRARYVQKIVYWGQILNSSITFTQKIRNKLQLCQLFSKFCSMNLRKIIRFKGNKKNIEIYTFDFIVKKQKNFNLSSCKINYSTYEYVLQNIMFERLEKKTQNITDYKEIIQQQKQIISNKLKSYENFLINQKDSKINEYDKLKFIILKNILKKAYYDLRDNIYLNNDKEYKIFRENFDELINNLILYYDWQEIKNQNQIEKTLEKYPNDGPTLFIKRVLERFNYEIQEYNIWMEYFYQIIYQNIYFNQELKIINKTVNYKWVKKIFEIKCVKVIQQGNGISNKQNFGNIGLQLLKSMGWKEQFKKR